MALNETHLHGKSWNGVDRFDINKIIYMAFQVLALRGHLWRLACFTVFKDLSHTVVTIE